MKYRKLIMSRPCNGDFIAAQKYFIGNSVDKFVVLMCTKLKSETNKTLK
jgi:hypothetical protein